MGITPIDFAKSNNLILENIPEENFIASGAEQKVYIIFRGFA
jgi:hypothetical protein